MSSSAIDIPQRVETCIQHNVTTNLKWMDCNQREATTILITSTTYFHRIEMFLGDADFPNPRMLLHQTSLVRKEIITSWLWSFNHQYSQIPYLMLQLLPLTDFVVIFLHHQTIQQANCLYYLHYVASLIHLQKLQHLIHVPIQLFF